MRQLPSGTVTFLFSDIEGSTKLLDGVGADAYAEALAEHRRIMRDAFTAHEGVEVDTQGDAFFVAFPTASGALAAARDAQTALADGPIRVRMGIHSGEPLLTEEGYVGIDVHRGARVMSAGHGGQVLVSHATFALGAADFPLRDLGRHRLKDLTEPQPLYQLGDGDFPPPKTLSQTNLPVQPTLLVGREQELAEVLALLDESRLVTLTGAGGSGKTRLALQAAAEVIEDYPDGVWWVSLAALRDPELVEPTIAQVVGAKDGVGDHLGEKRTLLLLDNFEQVVEAAPHIANLLAAAPAVRVLTTSRERLAIAGEHEYPVPTLAPTEGIALFTARARQLKPQFEPDEHVEGICRRLDGLPLAIELAAARVKVLTGEKILARLGKSLDLLTTGGRDVEDRHRTLRATIEWSHELLAPAERELFRRLAVFVGSFDFEAAEAVCEAELDALAALVDKSLLRQMEDGRFFMLETIREHALEQLEKGSDAEALRERHARYFCELAEEIEPELHAVHVAALAAVDADAPNLRLALEWSSDHSSRDLQARLTGSLYRYWGIRGLLDEGTRWIDAALSFRHKLDSDLRDRVLGAGAYLYAYRADARAKTLSEERLDLARNRGDRRGEAYALIILASLAQDEGHHSEAESLYQKGLALARAEGDDWGVALVMHNVGHFALEREDFDEARALLKDCLARSEAADDEEGVTLALADLGFVELLGGARDEAVERFTEALARAHTLGFLASVAEVLIGFAKLTADEHPEHAARFLGRARGIADECAFTFQPVYMRVEQRAAMRLAERLDEHSLVAALEQGRNATTDDVVKLALADDGLDAPPLPRGT